MSILLSNNHSVSSVRSARRDLVVAPAHAASAPAGGSVQGATPVSALAAIAGAPDSGIAVVATAMEGVLWYSTDGAASWRRAPRVNAHAALALGPDAWVVFQPGGVVPGAVADALSFRAWDLSREASGSLVDSSVATGARARISTVSVMVNAISDATLWRGLFGNLRYPSPRRR